MTKTEWKAYLEKMKNSRHQMFLTHDITWYESRDDLKDEFENCGDLEEALRRCHITYGRGGRSRRRF